MTTTTTLPVCLLPPFVHDAGFCWRAKLPDDMAWACDDNDNAAISPLVVTEDNLALRSGHAGHSSISESGAGRYSVWKGWVYFSASDNSDPNANGRSYAVCLSRQERGADLPKEIAALHVALNNCPAWMAMFVHESLDLETSLLKEIVFRYEDTQHQLEDSDVTFLSVQCSGRTWVRYFLQTYLANCTGQTLSMVPNAISRTAISPSVFFTHDFLDLFETVDFEPRVVFGASMMRRPLVLLTRDIRDTVVSWFHFMRRSLPSRFRHLVPGGELAGLIDSPVVGLEKLAKAQMVQREIFQQHPGPKLHLAYEDLRCDGEASFMKLVKFLVKSAINEAAFGEALEKSTFEAMQALEIKISQEGKVEEYYRLGVNQWSGDTNDLKVRMGKVGRFRDIAPFLDEPNVLATKYPCTYALISRRWTPDEDK